MTLSQVVFIFDAKGDQNLSTGLPIPGNGEMAVVLQATPHEA